MSYSAVSGEPVTPKAAIAPPLNDDRGENPMRMLIIPMAALALVSCNKTAPVANEAMANDAMANTAMVSAAFEIKGTSWEYTRNGKPIQESVDDAGNYVSHSGATHIDHGTAEMKGGKACFTSKMGKMGTSCWTTSPVEIGASMDSVSDKGEKLSVKRVAYVAPAPM